MCYLFFKMSTKPVCRNLHTNLSEGDRDIISLNVKVIIRYFATVKIESTF